ncbi:MAG: outer membrane beta-barrel protein [Candidatus Saccharicenans sp.]
MKKIIPVLLAVLFLFTATASAGIFTFRYGYYVPRMSGGPDSLWNIEFDNMSFRKSDFQGGMLGFGYEYFINRNLSLMLSLDLYSRNRGGYYRDWAMYSFDSQEFAFPASYFPEGDMIIHSFEVSQTPFQLSLKFTPLGRRVRFVPYFGGGVSLYLWSVRIHGRMIDFSDPYIYDDPDLGPIEVYPINYVISDENNRLSIGYHGFAGVMLPIGYRMTLDLGVRYNFLKVDFRDAFEGFEKFDLSGYVLTIGLNYWF